MLYSRSYLGSLNFHDLEIPLNRYYHKFTQGEIKRFKFHEKDFFFQNLKLFHKEECPNEFIYDLREIKAAQEYYFYSIILINADEYMEFNPINYCSYDKKRISAKELKKDERFFYEYLNVWKSQVESQIGSYFPVIYTELHRKLKLLLERRKKKEITKKEYKKKELYFWALFFHIYYTVRIYFDEKKDKFEEHNIGGYNIRFDIYSYVHILSRHYYPSMNNKMNVSLNPKINGVDIRELPLSILSLIKDHVAVSGLLRETEYLLYEIDGEKYILWLKYISDSTGFQIRSFYRCEQSYDIDKFADKVKTQIRECVFAYH